MKAQTWDIETPKRVACCPCNHMRPSTCSLYVSDPPPCAGGCSRERCYSCM